MRKRGSPLVGSVSHEASHYGPRLIHLGLLILRGETVAPYNYIAHRLVTPASLKKAKIAAKPSVAAAARK
jgi:ribose transport system substrate-binding protein